MKAILLNSLAIEYPTERCAEFSNLHELCRIGEERVPTDFQEIDDIRGTRCTGWFSRTGHLSEVSDFTRARRSSAARLAAMSEEQLAARPVARAASCQILLNLPTFRRATVARTPTLSRIVTQPDVSRF